jgi:uncharacterized membrane protein
MKRVPTVDELIRRNVEIIATIEQAANVRRTIGDRVADWVTATIGSWTFIAGQLILLGIWIVLNVIAWMRHWDPYPFILLNLFLSFQSAFASPIIMMSQNRQDRLSERRNHLELQISLLAEQENTETLRLLARICEKLQIDTADEPSINALTQMTRPERVVDQIEEAAGDPDRDRQKDDAG